MPNKATISGTLLDANLDPIVNGKIVATLKGSDIFDGGTRIVTQRVEATTDGSGNWSFALVVNGEGENASSTWDVKGTNEFTDQVFSLSNIFIPVNLAAKLGDLEQTSPNNIKAAKDASISRLIVTPTYAEYDAMPASNKRDNDIVLVVGA